MVLVLVVVVNCMNNKRCGDGGTVGEVRARPRIDTD